MIDYYDGILVAIIGCVLGGLAVGLFTGIRFQSGLLAGTLVATLFLYDAIFRHPPLPRTDPTMVAMVVAWHLSVGVLGAAVILG